MHPLSSARSVAQPAIVHVLQHTPDEGPGRAGRVLQARGVELQICRCDLGQPVPRDLGRGRGLLILGGPMGVYESERYPHVRDEIRLVERALAADAPILGICLGSQILAKALGARVHPGKLELGWLPVHLEAVARQDPLFDRAPTSFEALHWHGDVFDLPREALHLARSEMTPHQAFRFGDAAYGLLFHLEAEVAQIGKMAETFADDVAKAGLEPEALLTRSLEGVAATENLAMSLFDSWADML